MKLLISWSIVMMLCSNTFAQHKLSILVQGPDRSALPGASVSIDSLKRSAIADSTGLAVFRDLPAGKFKVRVSHIGREESIMEVLLPIPDDRPILVEMTGEEEEEEEEVIVTATRTSSSIRDAPTRVETISGEELEEKSNMKPGDIRMTLSETTGIQTQQTSATSYNSSIRIQGLDGRYTQLLRDGFPLYAGFSGGLSIMQVAPLDLRQVEVIKGSSSTLYGGGAIAGLVNLVSKVPGAKRELSFLGNVTSAGGLDLSSFYSERYGKFGMTVFGSRNSSAAYDPTDIGFTAIPKFERYTINPRLFFYGERTNASIGVSYITENRTGGSMDYIQHGESGYFEKNNTDRMTAQLDVRHQFREGLNLQFKSSYSVFDRSMKLPGYTFDGEQLSSYSELNVTLKRKKFFWIGGLNLLTDDFNESVIFTNDVRDYHYNTYGAFIQNSWTPSSVFALETGLRADYVEQYGFQWLPRISAMYKITPKFTVRLGGGLGYKTPTVFNEEAERMQFQNILPIDEATARNETSAGVNLDFNYRTHIGRLGISFNQLFFYTRLNRPLVLLRTPIDQFRFENANGHIDTRGAETNLRLSYSDFKLLIGYTYSDVNTHFDGEKNWLPLTARHRLNNILMYEKEEKWKLGLEAYYFSPQRLNDGAKGKSYWITGFMVEKLWEKFSLFINFENLFDTRQTRFDTIFTGSIDNPVFRDIYAPVDGFVINGGVKLKL